MTNFLCWYMYVIVCVLVYVFQNENVLEKLCNSLVLPEGWSVKLESSANYVDICKIGSVTSQPAVVTTCLSIFTDLTWKLYVHGKVVSVSGCTALAHTPATLNPTFTAELLSQIDTLNVCIGNPDHRFSALCEMHGGEFKAADGTIASFKDNYYPIKFEDEIYQSTIRSTKCSILTENTKCEVCKNYRATLRALCSRQQRTTEDTISKRTDVSSHTNYRYLTADQCKTRMCNLKEELDQQRNKVNELEKKIQKMIENNGQQVDSLLQNDLYNIMNENTSKVLQSYPEGSFQRLFWQQQLEALKVKDKRQVRWHPALIRWCLHLKLMSTCTYDALRSTGVLTLPCERTLRDYTHWMEAGPGFINQVDQHLMSQTKISSLPEFQKYVCLVFDEVKIKEDLVYDKNTAEIIGFTNFGDINNQLMELEHSETGSQPSLATNMLVFMVRGLFLKLEYPYAQFPCASLSGEHLFPIVWGCIERLEACGFKVIALTADGASCNRKFFKMHQIDSDSDKDTIMEDDEGPEADETLPDELKVTYKTTNIYSPDQRPLFFISDPPHLIKTVRNCWANSFAHTRSRTLQVYD